ncbi:hypothetical protein HDU93_004299 [Gonapodya sp. JEL0774]|nr:hypothetical protein HDU93_004299 [Gonapodya sp. JEL0774]
MSREESLIEAVELGNVARVRQLLSDGLNPNDARKRVTLSVTLGQTTRTDTAECESALALAIMHGHVDIVRLLLTHGADPTTPCEWRISNWVPPRNEDDWNVKRWYYTFSFPCALTLAIARGGTWTWSTGKTFDAPDSNGDLAVNKQGGHVHVVNPRRWQDNHIEFLLRPLLPIVSVLLQHGAHISDAVLDAARKQPDPSFLEAIEQHQMTVKSRSLNTERPLHMIAELPTPPLLAEPPIQLPLPPTPNETAAGAASASATQSTETLLALLAAQVRKNDDLSIQIDALKARNEDLSVRSAVSEIRTAEFERRVADLTTDNAHLKSSIRQLEAQAATHIARIAALELEISTLRSTSRPTQSHRDVSPSAEPSRAPLPPYTIDKVMYAVADFQARDTDEMSVAVGDAIHVSLGFADGWGLVGWSVVTARLIVGVVVPRGMGDESGFNSTSGISGAFPLACVSSRPSDTVLDSGPQPTHHTTTSLTIRYESRLGAPHSYLPQMTHSVPNLASPSYPLYPPADVLGPPRPRLNPSGPWPPPWRDLHATEHREGGFQSGAVQTGRRNGAGGRFENESTNSVDSTPDARSARPTVMSSSRVGLRSRSTLPSLPVSPPGSTTFSGTRV